MWESSGIRTLRVMEPAEITAVFDVAVDPAHSHYVGLRFVLETLEPLRARLASSQYKYHESEQGIVVDLTKELNLFFELAIAGMAV